MKLKLGNTIEQMAGTAANAQLVFYMRGGQLVARAKVEVSNPRTPEQVRARNNYTDSVRQWSDLSAEVRKAWDVWAARWRTTPQPASRPTLAMGRSVYISAAFQHKTMKMEPYMDTPFPLPAPELLSAEEVATGDPMKFSFRVRTAPIPVESDAELPQLAVIARITPATIRLARAPYHNQLRLIAGSSPASSCPLPAGAEAIVTFDSNRFSVETGQRFAFELTPVRLTDGIPGASLWVDAIRK